MSPDFSTFFYLFSCFLRYFFILKSLMLTPFTTPILQACLIVVFAPMLMGLVKCLKCRLQNRQSPSILQPYRNLNKLLRKDAHTAITASPIFHITPYIVFGIMVVISSFVPLIASQLLAPTMVTKTGVIGTIGVTGDIIVIVGLFALARFFLALAGMDVGTAFGGMGSSREMMIAAIAEPALLMVLFTVAMIASRTDVGGIFGYFSEHPFFLHPSLIFAAIGFALVAVAETGRIPVDNPATHLELTMVHEAMILEYSGRYLALLEWAAQIKFMIYYVLFVNLFLPWGTASITDLLHYFVARDIGVVDASATPHAVIGVIASVVLSIIMLAIKMLALCLVLVIAENHLAKLRLFRVPYLLNCAFLLCLLGILSYVIL